MTFPDNGRNPRTDARTLIISMSPPDFVDGDTNAHNSTVANPNERNIYHGAICVILADLIREHFTNIDWLSYGNDMKVSISELFYANKNIKNCTRAVYINLPSLFALYITQLSVHTSHVHLVHIWRNIWHWTKLNLTTFLAMFAYRMIPRKRMQER